MSRVVPMDGGKYSLRCLDCGEWVPNTANFEMKREGYIAHNHSCRPLARFDSYASDATIAKWDMRRWAALDAQLAAASVTPPCDNIEPDMAFARTLNGGEHGTTTGWLKDE